MICDRKYRRQDQQTKSVEAETADDRDPEAINSQHETGIVQLVENSSLALAAGSKCLQIDQLVLCKIPKHLPESM